MELFLMRNGKASGVFRGYKIENFYLKYVENEKFIRDRLIGLVFNRRFAKVLVSGCRVPHPCLASYSA
jgi:hypothetical protein